MDEYFYSNIRSIRFTPTYENLAKARWACASLASEKKKKAEKARDKHQELW